MKTKVKLALASMVTAILFFSPIGACSESRTASAKPSHPCCPRKPAPLPMDCARPGCIYLDTHVVPAPDTQTPQFSVIVIALPQSAILAALTQSTSSNFRFTPPKPPFDRYLAFCQILV